MTNAPSAPTDRPMLPPAPSSMYTPSASLWVTIFTLSKSACWHRAAGDARTSAIEAIRGYARMGREYTSTPPRGDTLRPMRQLRMSAIAISIAAAFTACESKEKPAEKSSAPSAAPGPRPSDGELPKLPALTLPDDPKRAAKVDL